MKEHGLSDYINKDYYRKLVDNAKEDLKGLGADVEFFLSDLQPEEKYGPTIAADIPEEIDGTKNLPTELLNTISDVAKLLYPNLKEPVPDFMNLPEDDREEIPFEEVS